MEHAQNATLVFISAYSVYVFSGKIRTSHALRSRTLLLRNNNTAVDTIVSTAVSVLARSTEKDITEFFEKTLVVRLFRPFL